MAKQIPVDYYGHNKHLILSYLILYYLTSSGSFTLETQPGRWGYRYSDDVPVIFVVSPTKNPSFKHLKH